MKHVQQHRHISATVSGSLSKNEAQALKAPQGYRVVRTVAFAVLLCTALIACVLMSGCAQSDQGKEQTHAYESELMDKGTLKVLVSSEYPPFSDGGAEVMWGYDIAVAEELANRLGLALELVPTSRDTIIETLACEPSATASEEEKPDPEGDVALAALAITEERDEKVDFSSWYYVGNQAVITMKEAEQPSSASSARASTDTALPRFVKPSTAQTTGKEKAPVTFESTAEFDPETTRIAVVKGSTCMQTARELTNEKLIIEYSTARKCLQALKAKEVQAVVLDLPVAEYLLAHEFSDMRIIERIMTGEAYGVALPTESINLKDAVNEALAAMEEDGALTRLQEEYIGNSY